ncbi:MAG: histidine phosphatase family protein [Myxococcales bacterium]
MASTEGVPAPEIYLSRHGETDANAEARVQGFLDPPLNERGRSQAAALAAKARTLGLRALYTSHLLRARETAAIVGEAIGVAPVVDERFAESSRGNWEGRLIAEIEAEDRSAWAAYMAAGPGFRFPGGESLGEHAARVEAALATVRSRPLPALVVCHGGTVRVALAAPDLADYHSLPVPNGVLLALPSGR